MKKPAIIMVIIMIIVIVMLATPLSFSDFTPEQIKKWILGFGILGPIIFMTLYALRGVILIIPVGVMSLAGGLAYGKWWGTLFILAGATGGAALSFLVSRHLGRGFIEKRGWLQKGKIKNIDMHLGENGFKWIIFMRLIPLFQYDALNFGAGLSKMRFRDYVAGSFIGMLPGGFINAMLGDSLDNIFSMQFIIALLCFLLLMAVPAIYTRIRKG